MLIMLNDAHHAVAHRRTPARPRAERWRLVPGTAWPLGQPAPSSRHRSPAIDTGCEGSSIVAAHACQAPCGTAPPRREALGQLGLPAKLPLHFAQSGPRAVAKYFDPG